MQLVPLQWKARLCSARLSHLRHSEGGLFLLGWVAVSAQWTYMTDYQPHSFKQLSHPAALCWAVCLPRHHGIRLPPLSQESSLGKQE